MITAPPAVTAGDNFVTFTLSLAGGLPNGAATMTNGTITQSIALDASGAVSGATLSFLLPPFALGAQTYTVSVPRAFGSPATRSVDVVVFQPPFIATFVANVFPGGGAIFFATFGGGGYTRGTIVDEAGSVVGVVPFSGGPPVGVSFTHRSAYTLLVTNGAGTTTSRTVIVEVL
jgi:hypothetical protein